MRKFLMTAAFALGLGVAGLGGSAVVATPANAQASFSLHVGDGYYHRHHRHHRHGWRHHRPYRYGYYHHRPYRYAGWRYRDRCFWRHGHRYCRW